MKLNVLLSVFVVQVSLLGCSQGGSLEKNFYKDTCRRAEDIVKEETEKHVASNPTVPAKLLRLHFHDCFVRGCDGSVLLNSTATNTAEKEAIPNQSLSGFDVIDAIKEQVEKECPGVVSCADILALAARDSVSYSFKKPMWEVLTGRRDGNVSLAREALVNIPPPFLNFTQLKQSFASKGLNVHDLVVLSGGHTIGVGHCSSFSSRLYNFTGKGDQDPSLDPKYAQILKSKCSPNDRTTTVEMDPGSSLEFDSNYYDILLQNKGLFQSDAALLTNKVARDTVEELVYQADFFTEFGQSMKRMGAIEVLTGTAGEIRKKCWAVNS
ncbi:Peroxidase [Parasponia andersonii]|uniref:Peroxidase n=1 Tax=Parasponia andersonii TaxID=3476 RepID=A0A2P5CFM2_PARAD|nr:Peroxidase [Parasponia andersonii]